MGVAKIVEIALPINAVAPADTVCPPEVTAPNMACRALPLNKFPAPLSSCCA